MSDITLEKGPIFGPSGMPQDKVSTAYDLGIYTIDTTQGHFLGRRYLTWDGRVFKYSRAGDTVYTGQGGMFYGATAIAYTTLAAAQSIGDKTITIASQTFAKDILAGGYAIIYGSSNADVQQRQIEANSVCAAATVTITLDAPLHYAVTASTGVEVLPNPYYDIRLGGSTWTSVAGVPAINATVGKFFWLQTWGICWIAPGEAGVGGVANERQLVFDGSVGALHPHTAAYATTLQYQHAGFIVNRDSNGSDGPPFVMLQISI